MKKIEIEGSDLSEISAVLDKAATMLTLRDKMNAVIHLAGEIKISPLTEAVMNANNKIRSILINNTTL